MKSLPFMEAATGAQRGLLIFPKSHSVLRADVKLNLLRHTVPLGYQELVSDTLEESISGSQRPRKATPGLAPGQNPKQGQEVLRLPPHASNTVQEPPSNAIPQRQPPSPSGDYTITGTCPTFGPWPEAPLLPAMLTSYSIKMTPAQVWNPSEEARCLLKGCDHKGGSKGILGD